MCSKEDYDKWERGETWLSHYGGDFSTKDEIIEEMKNDKYFKDRHPDIDWGSDEITEYFHDYEYDTCEEYFDDEYLETFDNSYTTPKGETVVCFGKYGYNG
jgi:hypothetical protein